MAEKYDTIGIDYNQTRRADPYLVERLHHHLAPNSAGTYLDIGSGTGNYTLALQAQGGHFIGIEPSTHMLAQARAKSSAIDWRSGRAEAIPLPDASVDGIVGTLTIHHWSNLSTAFGELYRVLRPGGRFVLFTSTPRQMKGYWLNHYFPQMLRDSKEQMPSWTTVNQQLEASGFRVIATEPYFVQPDLQDGFLYIGKHEPGLYLDKRIRKGISSFSALAHREEVELGLAKLQADIASGAVQQVMDQHKNEDGDYLFVNALKP